MLSGSTSGTKHHDVRPAEVLKSERLVAKAEEAVESFVNPFSTESQEQLLILSSGAAASHEVQRDVLRAEEAGKDAKETFIATRLIPGCNFFEPIKRLNLKTLGDMNKKGKVTTTKSKVVQFQQQGNIAFKMFMKSQSQGIQLDLRELLTYPLTPVPYSMGTADGFLAKSKSFSHLTKDVEDATLPPTDETLVIIDGNACFHQLKELPGDFSQICSKVFNMIPKTGDAVFSTDSYEPNSVKAMERLRRGTGTKLILKGEKTKKPADWKSFLCNDENKKQFIELLVRLWSQDGYASRLHGRRIIVTCDKKAYLLTSENGMSTTRVEIDDLNSTYEETDSRVILYCEYARRQSYSSVRVKSPDTDVFMILLHYASDMTDLKVFFDTGTGNHKRLIDVGEIAQGYTPEHATALLAMHAFSGCDTTSAFKGLGKVKPLKTMSKLPKFVPILSKLGDTWEVPETLMDDLDELTCALYSKPRIRSVN